MCRKLFTPFVLILILLYVGVAHSREIVLHDHFDDGLLDSAWQISLTDVFSWDFVEEGSEFVVHDISPDYYDVGSGAPWGIVDLSRAITGVDDFHIDFDLSWDSAGLPEAMQYLLLALLDMDGGEICTAGYRDSWVTARGEYYAVIGGSSYGSGVNSTEFAGTASIKFDRVGGVLTISADETELLVADASSVVGGVKITMGHYDYRVPPYTSVFGNLKVDHVHIDGIVNVTAVPPAPATFISQNYPNPFNPMTRFEVSLAVEGDAKIRVIDLQGREVSLLHDGSMAAGTHAIVWNGRDESGKELPSGIYLLSLEADRESRVRKITLLR